MINLTHPISILLIVLLLVSCNQDSIDPQAVIDDEISEIQQVSDGSQTINLYTLSSTVDGLDGSASVMKAGINYNTTKDKMGFFLISNNAHTNQFNIENVLSYDLNAQAKSETDANKSALNIELVKQATRKNSNDNKAAYILSVRDLLKDAKSSMQSKSFSIPEVNSQPAGIQHHKSALADDDIFNLYNCSYLSGGIEKSALWYSLVGVLYNEGEYEKTMDVLMQPQLVNNATIGRDENYVNIPKDFSVANTKRSNEPDYRGKPFENYQ